MITYTIMKSLLTLRIGTWAVSPIVVIVMTDQ